MSHGPIVSAPGEMITGVMILPAGLEQLPRQVKPTLGFSHSEHSTIGKGLKECKLYSIFSIGFDGEEKKKPFHNSFLMFFSFCLIVFKIYVYIS